MICSETESACRRVQNPADNLSKSEKTVDQETLRDTSEALWVIVHPNETLSLFILTLEEVCVCVCAKFS